MTYHYQEALARIRAAKAQNATKLDLSSLELHQIPDEIEDLKHLSSLNLCKSKVGCYNALENLPQLTELYLRHSKLQNISFLRTLKRLEKLDIGSNPILDYSPLEVLPALQCLILMGTIPNYDFLSDLPALNWLNLGHNRIKDYRFLRKIKKLTNLELEFCELEDLDFLEGLENLILLNAKSNKIERIDVLKSLPNLIYLNLSHNKIKDISLLLNLKKLKALNLQNSQFQDHSSLKALTRLTYLHIGQNDIKDISFLKSLTQLDDLDLRGNPINDFSILCSLKNLTKLNLSGIKNQEMGNFVKPLSNLKELYLIGCDIREMSFVKALNKLQQLLLMQNKITHFPIDIFSYLKDLIILSIEDNPIKNIPLKLYNKGENCCHHVRNYFKDLAKGCQPNDTLKVAFVGNARTGKTSLMRALKGEPFNDQEETTHSIYLKQWDATPKIRLNLWDFGGQHLYHATHRLFLQTEAIFILLWEQQNHQLETVEEDDPVSKQKFAFKNHENNYWLSYLKFGTKKSPIFLVQSKIDALNHQKAIPDQYHSWKKAFNLVDTFHIDAQTKRGINSLKEELILFAQKIIDEQPKMPKSWLQVRCAIQAMQLYNSNCKSKGESSPFKQLAINQFWALCKDNLDESSCLSLLEYLHNTGEVFYHSKLFDNQIIIDQEWLINAIYTLFDRKNHFYKLIQKSGKFSFADVSEHWNQANHSFEEQKHFLQYMQQCEICFEISYGKNNFEEKEWIAPYLLPETVSVAIRDIFEDKNDCVWMQMRHELFYYGIIQSFIGRARHLSAAHEMWRYGIYLSDKQAKAWIQANEKQNLVTIQVKGTNKKGLLDKIRNEFKKIQEHTPQLWVSSDSENYVPLSEVERYHKETDFYYAGHKYIINDFYVFLNVDHQLNFPTMPQFIKKAVLLKKHIQYLISKDKTSIAFEILDDWLLENPNKIDKEDGKLFLMLSSRYYHLENLISSGRTALLSPEEKTERTNIKYNILSFMDNLSENWTVNIHTY